jgi:hypothetical protein
MFIHITPDEFIEEFRIPWKQELIKSPHIDYATNAIHGWFEGKDVIIFRFKDYGWIMDNRFSGYNMSCGKAGITIQIVK